MVTLTFILMILSWIIFMIAIALMTPKWWIWFWVGGMTTSNEYWSKKSMEWTLKKTAIISIIVFTVCAIVYPYMNKKQLATNTVVSTSQTKSVKINSSDIKINWVNTNNVKIKAEPVKVDTNNIKTTDSTNNTTK